ncbi:hypothetical protein BN903_11 [Halorubrum sp. AJ67]|nr:hypothetical protein BN903_11 [Halorubrum sp. AJ67]
MSRRVAATEHSEVDRLGEFKSGRRHSFSVRFKFESSD